MISATKGSHILTKTFFQSNHHWEYRALVTWFEFNRCSPFIQDLSKPSWWYQFSLHFEPRCHQSSLTPLLSTPTFLQPQNSGGGGGGFFFGKNGATSSASAAAPGKSTATAAAVLGFANTANSLISGEWGRLLFLGEMLSFHRRHIRREELFHLLLADGPSETLK